MKLRGELAGFMAEEESILTIGVFDGVHRGHGYLMSRLKSIASGKRGRSGVITFTNHPASIVHRNFQPSFLTSLDERLSLLTETGVDFIAPVTFDHQVAQLKARDFISLLQCYLGMKGLVVGPDFSMGHNRESGVRSLVALGKELGFTVDIIDLQSKNGLSIRSTEIRRLLSIGDMPRASNMLGRPFSLTGIVEMGKARGRYLGYPTANLRIPPDMAIPCDGIYATWAQIAGNRLMAATSIGTKPTFGDGDRTVEAFLLDFDRDIYGQELTLKFVERLRDELHFDSVQDLLTQMEIDVSQTRSILSSQ